jgi:CheY-like chemotaxis protein
MLVEDNPGDASLMRRLVASIPGKFLITHVANLTDALEILGRKSTDVLLLDLGLPDSVGLETLSRVRDSAPNVPVIVITGLSEREIAVQALGLGAQDFIAKERVDVRLLEKAILRAVRMLLKDQSPAPSQ